MEKQCTHEKCVDRTAEFKNGCKKFRKVQDCGSHRLDKILQKYSEEYAKKEGLKW